MDHEITPNATAELVSLKPEQIQLAETLRPFFLYGAQVKFNEHGVIEAVTYVIAERVEQEVSDLLFELGIEPKVERGNGVVEYHIDNKRQITLLQKLDLAPQTLHLSPSETTEDIETETDADETGSVQEPVIPKKPTGFEFPLKHLPTFRSKIISAQTLAKVPMQTEEDPPGADTDLHEIIEDFRTGHSAENTLEAISAKNPYRSTEKFTRAYQWRQGELYTVSGEHISQETFMHLLEEAKISEAALAQVMKMNEGLLHYVYQNIIRKYNPNHIIDADDLLQAGRLGLLRAIKNREPGITYGYQSYFIKYMEGYMRRVLRMRGALTFPSTAPGTPGKFYTALRSIEAEKGPQFILTTELEEQIARRTNIDPRDVKVFGQAVFGRLALTYDEENEEQYNEAQIGREDRSHTEDATFDAYALSELADTISELLNTIDGREDLVVRMRFGIADNSDRWRDEDMLSLFTDAGVRRRIADRLTELTSKQLLSLTVFKNLTKAERFFLTLTGHLPLGAIADLRGPVDAHNAVCTLDEVGGMLGVSKDRVRQIEAKALRHLRYPSRARKIRSFLDE